MPYVVFEDLDDATETKVHDAACRYYQTRESGATTVRWHGPFETHVDATEAARRIEETKRYEARDAGCCI